MVLFPNCKINLGLNIVRKRPDGYHDLETVFYPIALKDALEAVTDDTLSFQTSGLKIHGDVADNLCLKAYHLLLHDFPHLPKVKIHLHKAIPMGAGLGGGSADGACMLLLLNKKFNLGLSTEQLVSYALQLGSDCPFFIINKPVFATGRGEVMTDISIDLNGYIFVIVNPGIHISTKEAFSNLSPAVPAKSIADIVAQPFATWKHELFNDFERPLFQQYPAIAQVKESLYDQGAVYASMSGSGSTVFGIFKTAEKLQFNFPPHYLQFQLAAS